MFGGYNRFKLSIFILLGSVILMSACSKLENPKDDKSSTSKDDSVYLPDGVILKFKNDFESAHRVNPAVTIRLNIQQSGITAFRYKQITLDQSCGDASAGSFGPIVTDAFYDFTPSVEGRFVVCAIGLFESSGQWLSENRAVFSKIITVDSTPPSGASVYFNSLYTSNLVSTAYFVATDVTRLGYSFVSCSAIDTFIAYTNRFPFALVQNSSNTIYVKYRDDLDNETACVTATIVHDNLLPAAPVLVTPNLSNVFSRLQTDIDFEVDCEPYATLKISGFFSDEEICDVSGKYIKKVPTALLIEGDNNISFTQVDRAGNISPVTSGILKYENYVKGYSLPLVDIEINETFQQILIPLNASEPSIVDRTVSYVIESENTTQGSLYFTYYDVDGVTELSPSSYRVVGQVKIPAGQATTNIKINWLGSAQAKAIAKMRVYLNGEQRREKRYATDIYIKTTSATPKLSKIAVGEKIICGLLQGQNKTPCMGRSDIYQISSSTTGINIWNSDSFALGAPALDLAVGGQLSCVIDATKKIQCRGLIYTGTSSSTPTDNQVVSSVDVTSFAVGYAHVCGITAAGLRCWGKPGEGQLGGVSSGPAMPSAPSIVNLGVGVTPVKVAAGNYHTCVLIQETANPSNKNVKCFGNNIHGQLGIESLVTKGLTAGDMTTLPTVKFKAGRHPVDIYSGGYHNCAILDDGSVSCWGKNSSGQLGLGFSYDVGGRAYAELETIDFKTSTAIAKLDLGENHSCALFVDKTVRCWGDNSFFQLGTGVDTSIGNTPVSMELWPTVSIQNSSDISDLVVGGNVSCVVYSTGDSRCWGENTSGQRGVPYLKNHNAARPVFGSSKYKQVSTAFNHTCAITEDGKLDCWGVSGGGLLGDGSNSVNYFPVGNAESRTFKKVATGTTMSCAQTIENELYCWGMNDRRQLGAGLNVEYVTTPVKVDTALVFTDFVVGAQHACGLVSSGDVYCWGANNYGQLGLGDLTDRPTPVKVAALSDVKKLYAGLKVTCATSGTEVRLYCWGSNGGQMLVPASAATVNVTSPTVIVGPLSLSNQHIHDVAIYADHICYVVARWTDATKTAYMSGSPLSYCRGANGFAQINSSGTNPYTSWESGGVSYPWKIRVGVTFTCALVQNATFSDVNQGGTVYCKGDNTGGYLGANSASEYSDTFGLVTYLDNALTKVGVTLKASDISVAATHACAIERYLESPSGTYKNGRLFCWGNNKVGQMGEMEMAAFYREKTLILKHLFSR